jgi:Reverse transcriptase (RNA-dependent DNA polymerase)
MTIPIHVSWQVQDVISNTRYIKDEISAVKAYKVISLLNCLGKVVEKVAATALSRLCEEKELLHPGQFGYRKQRSAIDAVAKLIYTIKKAWGKKKYLKALFLDVKGAFNYIAKNRLLSRMKELNIPSYLVR